MWFSLVCRDSLTQFSLSGLCGSVKFVGIVWLSLVCQDCVAQFSLSALGLCGSV